MNIHDPISIFDEFRKIQEADFVRHGVPVTREFSDAELAEANEQLDEADELITQIWDTSCHS